MDREGHCVGKMAPEELAEWIGKAIVQVKQGHRKDCQPKCGEGRRTVGMKDGLMTLA